MRLIEIALKRLDECVNEAMELTKKTVELSLQAIKEKEKEEKRTKVKEYVQELRRLNDEIDELALETIARFQPIASDLRKVKAYMELGYDLLRLGRYAYDALAAFSRAEKMGIECETKRFDELRPLVESMINDALRSFKELNTILAFKVISKDDDVDEKYHSNLIDIMKNEQSVPCAVVEALSIKFLERLADHASHIAALTIFVVEGKMPE
ncbi:hypothetical protein EYM_04650 [Ignicoccus islandicus DSM 13165]|uniref:PhoU domain-containing protein n=1 Tax=Ignicoccus islandicus DSM 13165 TaxID=940295 RepID=A0A0U2MB11_9CREN|nr:PhoU domain-containing protein [Ignicoccus islandicus]ALU12509.1 hypothetical protein EYM_04650 [Ignicoccus islandicus DSM 13165]